MKKLILPLLFLLFAMQAMTQTVVWVGGHVTNNSNGQPIPNQPVTISNDSTGGWVYNSTVYTDVNGFYADTVSVPAPAVGTLYIRTTDCQNYQHLATVTYAPAQLNFTVDFSICYNGVPCQANFSAQQSFPAFNVQFTDWSYGGQNLRQWQFGDGGSSSAANPSHQYAAAGIYNVTLTIGALGTTCYNQITLPVHVFDSTGGGGGCQAAFNILPDSLNTWHTFHFMDMSQGNIISWYWNFGDGLTSQEQNPIHTYAFGGTYNVCLTIHGSDSTCFDMTCTTLVITEPGPCHSEFTSYSDSIGSPNVIHFVDQSTGNIAYWNWVFGDGTSSSLQNPVHTYAQPGTYNVCLSVHGTDSTCYDVSCQTIVVNGSGNCHAAFTYYADSTGGSNTYHFIDQSTGNISTWLWSFGDGSTSTLQNPVHTYAAPGYYGVMLTVGNPNQLCYDTSIDTIYIAGGGGCQAYFTYNSNPAGGSHSILFTDLSSGNPTGWLWSFGDGTASTVQNPSHTFAATGNYTVCLTITSPNCTDTWCQTVSVNDSTTWHQVYGQVFAGNFPLTLGMAMIFSLDTTNTFQPFVAVTPLDSNGVYYFTQVPDGSYYIMAIPFDSAGYLPTYYGNTIDWEQATLVTFGTPANPYDIHLVPCGIMMPGPGSTSGQINTGDVISSLTDKINMIIMNEQGTPIGFTRVSESGAFGFPSLAYGTYFLRPEMPGVTSDVVKIVLSAANPHADVVMTFLGNNIMGIEGKGSPVNTWSVYPNPVADRLNVSLGLEHGSSVTVELFDSMGRLVSATDNTLATGSNTLNINTSSLNAGIYTLRIRNNGSINISTKVVKVK